MLFDRRLGGRVLGVIFTHALLNVAASDFTDERFGLPTVRDILSELEKPGRDPRPEFKTASFKDGVESLSDLRPDMILEGAVTNVTHRLLRIHTNAFDHYQPGPKLELRDRAGKTVFVGVSSPWRNGQIHDDSGDRGWWFDFSPFSQ